MSILSPWLKLIRAASEGIGRRTKLPDVEMNWTHANKIKELWDDSGLSASYLKELIENSAKKSDLLTIRSYLMHKDKAINLDASTMQYFMRSIHAKVDQIEEAHLLKQLAYIVRESGVDLEDVLHHLM